MTYYVYLDHNIFDEIRKKRLNLKPSDDVIWVYSHESLSEIKRSGDLQFLDVLDEIKARKIEVTLNSKFRITNDAQIHSYRSVREEYECYLEATSEFDLDDSSELEIMARLHGASNHSEVLSHSSVFENNIKSLLEPLGVYDESIKSEVERVCEMIDEFVHGAMQEIGTIDEIRNAMGAGRGRAGNLADTDDPISGIWELISNRLHGLTQDQFFGFDPVDKQGYEEWPFFLGIVGCYSILNHLGFSPDTGLTKPQRLPSIMSDASHVGHAAYCHGLLSLDKRLLVKAGAIYRYKNITTQLISLK